MPDETRNYVKIITGQPIEKWTERAQIDVAVHLPPMAPCEGVQGLSRTGRRPHPGEHDAGHCENH